MIILFNLKGFTYVADFGRHFGNNLPEYGNNGSSDEMHQSIRSVSARSPRRAPRQHDEQLRVFPQSSNNPMSSGHQFYNHNHSHIQHSSNNHQRNPQFANPIRQPPHLQGFHVATEENMEVQQGVGSPML